ncbi:MAG: cation diffusion facilitator family transporter [Paludibacter sp.]|nr:cation diffusion facilitator family transporter [Bacteroidales bacterium]MCM1068620.1 cation diffusion facilitator family transporter [Prevotella sp.]MCM1353284.1 cation diffusion facilitator family transporter [Bacteroides sp.]MCM1442308.1 cation diffusion facilitator family transporter [Muribaculum sp.]MCM1481127.1 cation diffusion facilitator family transporter [Paludibacter sp.]
MAHQHEHISAEQLSSKKIVVFATVLNLLFVVVEAALGWYAGSLSLLSDAGHNLSDVLSLVLVLIAFRLMRHAKTQRYTYGYRKSSILISLLNALLLLVAVGAILVEGVHKLREPIAVNGTLVSWTAGVGILVNGLTALLLMRDQHKDLNIRGAFLHMLADTLVSVGVVLSGVLITLTGITVIDSIMSILIAVVILISTWHLLTDSVRLALDGIPDGIELEHVQQRMRSVTGVADVWHVHIWAISTTENALTAHIRLQNMESMENVRHGLRQILAEEGITHTTLEFEG